MTIAVTVDVAGGPMGGAARFRAEFYSYLRRSERHDVRVIGDRQRVNPSWLLRREASTSGRRRVALNNVGFFSPGGERWTLLGNALHFLSNGEAAKLDPSLRISAQRQAAVVRLAAKRSHVLIAPCTAMAERIKRTMPGVSRRVVVRMHPVSPHLIPQVPRDSVILCPVIWESYKKMAPQVAELLQVMDCLGDSSLRLQLTAQRSEVPDSIASHPRVHLVRTPIPRRSMHPLGKERGDLLPIGPRVIRLPTRRGARQRPSCYRT